MQLDEALTHVEALVQRMTAALQGNADVPPHDVVAEQLRDCMIAFSGLAQNYGPEQFTDAARQRMLVISQQLAAQREHLVRMGAITAQQAQALVPQQRDGNTYGAVGASGPQGGRASVSKLYHISG